MAERPRVLGGQCADRAIPARLGSHSVTTLEQSRYLATAIPGPRSKELIDRKVAAVSRGIGNTMPVYTARAGGGIVEDVDGNRLIDLGSGYRRHHDRQRVAARRRGGARAGRRLHPHLLHDHAVRGVRRRRRGAQPAHPRRLREALSAVQLGVRSGGERRQDRQDIHPQAGGGVLRSRLSRPHQPDHGADREVDAVQARLRPVRAGDLPCAAVLPVPRRGVRQGDGDRRRSGCPPRHQRHREAGRRRQPGRGHHRADPGRGWIHRPRGRLPARAAGLVCEERRGVHRRRGTDRVRAHRRDVRLRARGHRARPDRHRQGHRRWPPSIGGDRPRRDDGRAARQRSRRNLRRQSGRMRGRAGHHRDDRIRRVGGAGRSRSSRS